MRHIYNIIAVFLIVVVASPVAAQIITIPTSLSAGDQYRLAFYSSTTTTATSTDIAVYNSFVDNLAETVIQLAALNQDWKAIASTASVDARDNTSTRPSSVTGGSLGVPIFLLNDTKLVDNYDDLWDGSIDTSFGIDESGNNSFGDVWTGTTTTGVADADPLGSATPMRGNEVLTNSNWINFANNSPASFQNHVYAISGVLTVPEPTSFALFGIAMIGIARRRRR